MSFKRTDLFGKHFAAFKPQAQGHVVNMVIDGRIDKDGIVSPGAELSELWSYLYILALHNKDHEVFEKFRAQRGYLKTKVTAKRFYKSLQEYSNHEVIDEEDLMKFINETIEKSKPENPIIEMVSQYSANGIISSCEPDNTFKVLMMSMKSLKSSGLHANLIIPLKMPSKKSCIRVLMMSMKSLKSSGTLPVCIRLSQINQVLNQVKRVRMLSVRTTLRQ
jgi:hypothetical protein